jgi:hypothetical protein
MKSMILAFAILASAAHAQEKKPTKLSDFAGAKMTAPQKDERSLSQIRNEFMDTKEKILLEKSQAFIGGSEGTGGGDLCEDRIKLVRDDIKEWIVKGGPNGLKLPEGLSVETYSKGMLEQIRKTKISCVGQKDRGYPVEVYGTPKVCRFDRDANSSLVTCDFEKFQKMSESDQYVLVHHEFAGLADYERPNRDDSDYRISNQISANLASQIVKKLVVRKSVLTGDWQAVPESQLRELSAAIRAYDYPNHCKIRPTLYGAVGQAASCFASSNTGLNPLKSDIGNWMTCSAIPGTKATYEAVLSILDGTTQAYHRTLNGRPLWMFVDTVSRRNLTDTDQVVFTGGIDAKSFISMQLISTRQAESTVSTGDLNTPGQGKVLMQSIFQVDCTTK